MVDSMQKAMKETNDQLRENHFRLDEKLDALMFHFDKIKVKRIFYFLFNINFLS